ncbi:MAG: nuclease-related domain-containing protein [Chlorobium sp.]
MLSKNFSSMPYSMTFLVVVGFLIGLALFLAYLAGYTLGKRRRRSEENTGEAAVRRLLSIVFAGKDFHLMNSVTLPIGGGTTQIDHILISRFGVFVIETKHYTGWIFGDASNPTWTQVVFHKRSRFQNPIHQNYKHVMTVRDVLDFLPAEDVRSVVVFTGDAEFKTSRPEGVLLFNELISHIQSFREERISENRMQFCVGRLETTRRMISGRTDVEHLVFLDSKFGRVN